MWTLEQILKVKFQYSLTKFIECTQIIRKLWSAFTLIYIFHYIPFGSKLYIQYELCRLSYNVQIVHLSISIMVPELPTVSQSIFKLNYMHIQYERINTFIYDEFTLTQWQTCASSSGENLTFFITV